MSKIYVGQDATITLNAGISLTTASTLQIRYIKPNSSTVVTALTATASTTYASAALTPAILDTAGTYRFWIHAVISNKIYIGEIFKQEITAVGL